MSNRGKKAYMTAATRTSQFDSTTNRRGDGVKKTLVYLVCNPHMMHNSIIKWSIISYSAFACAFILFCRCIGRHCEWKKNSVVWIFDLTSTKRRYYSRIDTSQMHAHQAVEISQHNFSKIQTYTHKQICKKCTYNTQRVYWAYFYRIRKAVCKIKQ